MASFFLTNSFIQRNYIKHLVGAKSGNIKQKENVKNKKHDP